MDDEGKGKEDNFAGPPAVYSAAVSATLVLLLLQLLL